jgi:hypothetical protein
MQLLQPVAVALLPATSSIDFHDCPWRCTTNQSGPHPDKWHRKAPEYPEGGNSSRDNGAPKSWKDAGLVPWLHPEKDDGVNSFHAGTDYHIKRHSPAKSYAFPTYATEGHHCISCEAFSESEYPALVHNALLMGYDINCRENGFHVPAFVVDIVSHDLQHHASSHTWSEPAPLEYDLDDKLRGYLAQLQEWSLQYCRLDLMGETQAQQKILEDLHALSDLVRRRIKSWSFFLTKLAKMRLEDVRKYGQPVPKPLSKSKVKLPDSEWWIEREYRDAAFSRKTLMPSDFPNWDYYIAEALKALDEGANGMEPFSRWISRKMLEDKLGQKGLFAVDQPQA